MARRQSQKEDNLVRILRYALGVAPAEFALLPDEQGWVPVKELLAALNQEEGWRGLRQGMLSDAATRLAPELVELEEKRIRVSERSFEPPDYRRLPSGPSLPGRTAQGLAGAQAPRHRGDPRRPPLGYWPPARQRP